MSRYNFQNEDEFSDGNRYYWRIPKGLPSPNTINLDFVLHKEKWIYEASFSSDRLRITVSYEYPRYYCLEIVSIRMGIIGHDQREIVSSKAFGSNIRSGKTDFISDHLIYKSELYDMVMQKEAFYIFVEMASVNDEKEQCIQQIFCKYS